MRQLYLHIGPQKTGSTYLHSVLARNKSLLEAAGLGFAPYFNDHSGCHYLQFIAALRSKGAAAVLDETAAVPGTRVLVTDEDLARFLLTPAPENGNGDGELWAHAFHAAAARHFVPRIVYFARRQDYLAESHFSQGVKTWYSGRPADFPEQDYDHDGRLAALEAVFGQGNVTVILYRDGAGGDIAGDFFAAIGLADVLPRLDRDVAKRNVSMSRRKALFLTHVPKNRRRRPSLLVPPGMPEFIVEVVANSRAVTDDGVRFVFSPEARRALVARHLEGNRALVARYGIADPGAFVELPAPDPAWTPPAPITNREIAAIFRETVAACWALRPKRRAAGMTARLPGLFTRIAARARRFHAA